jgi:hypothetical protein
MPVNVRDEIVVDPIDGTPDEKEILVRWRRAYRVRWDDGDSRCSSQFRRDIVSLSDAARRLL